MDINNAQAPQMPQQQVTLKDTSGIECSGCQSSIFQNGVILRRVSAILTGTGKDAIVPVQVPYCIQCKKPLEDLLPDELKSTSDIVV